MCNDVYSLDLEKCFAHFPPDSCCGRLLLRLLVRWWTLKISQSATTSSRPSSLNAIFEWLKPCTSFSRDMYKDHCWIYNELPR